jgi:hypothetical protein
VCVHAGAGVYAAVDVGLLFVVDEDVLVRVDGRVCVHERVLSFVDEEVNGCSWVLVDG